MCDLIERYLKDGHEAEDLLVFLNWNIKNCQSSLVLISQWLQKKWEEDG